MKSILPWKRIVKNYPNEWVALIDAKDTGAEVIEGRPIVHAKERDKFNKLTKQALETHPHISIVYTGPLISETDTPLLWQISNIAQ